MQSLPPYARMLDITAVRDGDGRLTFSMPFGNKVLGRPGFLHGGAIGGLLEVAGLGTLYDIVRDDSVRANPINLTVSYLRGGVDHPTFAEAEIVRLGKRIANVEVQAWQADRTKLIATARMNLLLRRG